MLAMAESSAAVLKAGVGVGEAMGNAAGNSAESAACQCELATATCPSDCLAEERWPAFKERLL